MEDDDTSPPATTEPQRRRGIYLLPNLFTTAGLFAGFYAIVAAMKGHYEPAAVAIFIAMVMDSIDGRIARLTNTQSDFGKEYDSLADMVSFGLAPALVMYSWSLHSLNKIGWLAAFIYTAGAALRLARFNTQVARVDKKWFIGLPSPAAAAVVASAVWVLHSYGIDGQEMRWLALFLTVITGLLMVSPIRYYSFKEFHFKDKVPFVAMLVVVLIFVLITYSPPEVLCLAFIGYALSGPVTSLWQRYRRFRQRGAVSTELPPPDND